MTPKQARTLADHEARIRGFIETHMVDPDGIIYDGINADTGRPFTKTEAARAIAERSGWERKTDAPERLQPFTNYEDSDMATADYLASQVHRHAVTRESDALEAARRGFSAICRIAEEGAKHEHGYLPKPYGGVQGAAHSRETSPDQYTKVVLALDLFRRTVATPGESQRAKDLIVSFAEYWDRHNCTTMWFGSLVPWNGPHPNAYVLYLMTLAHRLTRRRTFLRWYELYLERRHVLWSWPFCSGNMASLIVRSMSRLLHLRPDERKTWTRAIRHNYARASKSLHPSGYCRANPPRDQIILHGVSTQLASSAVCVSELNETRAPLALAGNILLKTGQGGKVFHSRVLDAGQATATDRLEAKKVCGYYMAGWELAYWHRRRLME